MKVRNEMSPDRNNEFSRLFELHRPELTRVAAAQIPARLKRVIEPSDILQEAFICARRGFGSFEPHQPGALGAWLRTVVRNKGKEMVRDEYRDKRNRRQLLTEQRRR